MSAFNGFIFEEFWNNTEWAMKKTGRALAKEDIERTESVLGYTLPPPYIELMENRNGGVPAKNFYVPQDETAYAVCLTNIFGMDAAQKYSLCGELGSRFRIEEWGYPAYGIYFADTISGGHELFLMDYRKCGKSGEPEIVLIDQESDYRITYIAENFETFIKGLMFEEDVPEDRL